MKENQRVKELLAQMLCWFHGVCQAHGLRYYALGGTMLGAVRHQGFIPWDDDVDVGMPRSDYLRFWAVMEQMPPSRYRLETPFSANADFCYTFSKLYDTQTTLVENTRHRIRRGLYLDIFPLDGIGNSPREAAVLHRRILWRGNLLLALTAGIRQERSFWKNGAVCLMRLLPQRYLKTALQRSLHRLCGQRDFDDCPWCGNLTGNYGARERMPRAYFGNPTLYPFEHFFIYGPEQAEPYLTHLYGDWRQLPPAEKQKSHHDFLLVDTERGYL